MNRLENNDANTGKRIYGLDILRAAAIIFVMLSHGQIYFDNIIDPRYYWQLVLDGVGLFFVLSGFLIGGILIKTIAENGFTARQLLNFWIRRWFRTLPNYYLILIILTILYFVSHHNLPPKLAQYFTFTQCFAWQHPFFFGEAWSLAVEEWFYILIPAGLFALLFFTKDNYRYMLAWILFVLLAGTLIRVLKVSQHDYFIDNSFALEITKQVVTRMDTIMYGMLGAWLSMYKPGIWQQHKNFLFITGLILLFGSKIAIFHSSFFYGYFYYSVSAFGALCLLPKLSSIKRGDGLVFNIITFVSIISYSMYLSNHMIVQRAIMPPLQRLIRLDLSQSNANNIIALVLFWLLTIAISYVLYRFWEKPVMKLRDKLKMKEK